MGDSIGHAIDSAIEEQVGERAQAADIQVEFESDRDPPSGTMKVWRLGKYRAELKYLRFPDSGDPMPDPWFVKVMGPDPLRDGRIGDLWSRSYDNRADAEEGATDRLRKESRRGARRGFDEQTVHPRDVDRTPHTDDALGYAIWDPETKGFARQGMMGQQVFGTVGDAWSVAAAGQKVVALHPIEPPEP